MNNIDLFLVQYGLAAIFIVLLLKTIGVPIPIPADLIIFTAAARSAQGKLIAWQSFPRPTLCPGLSGWITFQTHQQCATIIKDNPAGAGVPRNRICAVASSLPQEKGGST